MKVSMLFILVSIALLQQSCRDKEGSDNIVDPSLGGAYTELKGNVSGTLSIEDSPFLVKENVNVPDSAVLVIEPGVSLFFEEGTHLNVNGVLLALGSDQKQITFTSFLSSWSGISILNVNDTSKLNYCVIQQVYQKSDDQFVYGAVEVSNSKIIIENCIFRINSSLYGGGLSLFNSFASIKNNIFRDNDADYYGGAILSQESHTEIVNNTIYRNGCYNYGGGIVLWQPQETDIQNNIFYKNFSFTGNPGISIATGDSSNVRQQFNYVAIGTMDPMFVSSDNLHLSAQSPCIDNGNPDSVFNDFDGSRNDQGAFGGPDGNW